MTAETLLATSARTPSWEVWLLNSEDAPLRRLSSVRSGDVTLASTERLGGSATIEIGDEDAEHIDWQRDRCRIIYDPGIPGVEPWAVGTYLFTSPDYHRRLVSSWRVTLQTKMLVLDEASTMGAWSMPAGRNLIEAVTELIQSTGETRIAATPSQTVNSAPITFMQGESILTVVNTLLEAANYHGCYTDGVGQFVLAPYQVPADRPTRWHFASGAASLHSPDWERTQDQSSVPNRVEVFTAGDEEEDPLIGVAENTDPDSPYSFQARGRWIVRREQVEAASQSEVDGLAQRYLVGAMSPVAKLNVTHAMLPIAPRDVVRFESRGISTRAAVQRMQFPLTFDSQVTAVWNEVNE